MAANPALDLAPFGRWTLRDTTAQRRSALRYAARRGITASTTKNRLVNAAG